MDSIKILLVSVLLVLCTAFAGAQNLVSDTVELEFKTTFLKDSTDVDQLKKGLEEYLASYGAQVSFMTPDDSGIVPVVEKVDTISNWLDVFTGCVDFFKSDTRTVWTDLTSRTPVFAVRTNALAIPLLNLGVEVPINRNWSVAADYYYPWFFRGSNMRNCNQILAFDVEGRYWFSDDRLSNETRLLGHSVGLYVAGGYYDFERDWSGHQGEFVNVGADYVYAIPIMGGLMNLEFELGLGYIYSRALPYKYIADKFYLDNNVAQHIHWFGPTRAQVSVSVPVHISREQWVGFTGMVSETFHECVDVVSGWFKRK